MSSELEQWLEEVVKKQIANLVEIDGGDDGASAQCWAEFEIAFYVLTHLRDGAPLPGWDPEYRNTLLKRDGRAEQYAKLHGVAD